MSFGLFVNTYMLNFLKDYVVRDLVEDMETKLMSSHAMTHQQTQVLDSINGQFTMLSSRKVS